jgi:Protein of unknown function (DUF1553)/Protein of unknown function (DUF1549)
MPRRRLGSLVLLFSGSVLWVGCQSRVDPKIEPASLTTAVQASSSVPAHTGEKPVEPAPPPLVISPESFTIAADDQGVQLLAGLKDDASSRDLTSLVAWSVAPAGVARIEPAGYLQAIGHGTVTVKAEWKGQTASAQVTIEPRDDRTWSFAEDIVPILTRMGCNTGGCHGKADGQNGFHLSLFGYDRSGDFKAVARDAGQRRVSRLSPEESLFLAKATGRVPHGGGQRLTLGSPQYQTLLAWVRAGAPETKGKSRGALVSMSIEPGTVRLGEPGPRQLRVIAQYEDGHQRDVTRLATYRANDDSVVSVNPQGRAELLRRGETDIIVRYQSRVQAGRLAAVVNPGLALDFSKLRRRNFIDDELFKRLESLKVPPSPPASDAAFFRRASLDLTGQQPPPGEVRRFLADTDSDKRIKLIKTLLSSHEFIGFWRIKLGDLLQISSTRQGNGAYRYQAWIDERLRQNTRWDELVRTLLTAVGDPTDREIGGPVNYAMDALDPKDQAELTAQRFLGLRLRCAQCHDHPFDIWTQDAYYGLASFFAKVQRGGSGGPGAMMGKPAITINPKGQVVHLRTQQPAEPRLLDGKTVKVAESEDPRKALAGWLTSPENPYFARAAVNWVWAQLFGKGLVDPPDDMSRANPPVHPELLDALARHFVASKFDLRDLVLTIATSEAYGLSSGTVAGNERDTRLSSHHLPRPLTAHQIADALAQATDVPIRFQIGPRRVIDLADPMTANSILDTFGRCPRTTACAATPAPPLSLRQALLLIGGNVIQERVASLNGYLASAMKLELEPEELVENLYFRTVCRPPTAEETSHWAAELKQAASRREAAEDLFWALLNSREFAFNH